MITKLQAETASHGDIIHHNKNKNADDTCQRWRVTGKPKTWKTRPNDFRVPIKYGFYGPSDYLTQRNNAGFHLVEDCNVPIADNDIDLELEGVKKQATNSV